MEAVIIISIYIIIGAIVAGVTVGLQDAKGETGDETFIYTGAFWPIAILLGIVICIAAISSAITTWIYKEINNPKDNV